MLKYIFLAFVTLSSSFASGKTTNTTNIWENLEENLRGGYITAQLNEYAVNLFKKIGNFAINDGLDPVLLKDFDENFLLARIELTEGLMHGISTIESYTDVLLTYRHDEKMLDIVFPIEFTNLNFTYDYHLTLLLMGPKGTLIGSIKDFKMNLAISFDFNTYQANIDSITTVSTGNIDLQFHGQILDIVINILCKFTTAILHPFLNLIVEGEVKNVVTKFVDDFNKFLNHLHDVEAF